MGSYVLAIQIKWCGPWRGIVVASSSQVQLLYGRGLESRYGWEKNRIYKKRKEGSSPGVMVMGGDSCSKGCGFKSQHCILDGHFFTYICSKNCNDVCLKRPKTNNKRDRGLPIF